MVGIKTHICPSSPLFLVWGRSLDFCQFPRAMRDETWTFDRCLFEYQTEPWRPADGGQIAFQTGASVWGQSNGGRDHLCSSMVLEGNGCTTLSSAWLSSLSSSSSWPSPLEQTSVVSLSTLCFSISCLCLMFAFVYLAIYETEFWTKTQQKKYLFIW